MAECRLCSHIPVVKTVGLGRISGCGRSMAVFDTVSAVWPMISSLLRFSSQWVLKTPRQHPTSRKYWGGAYSAGHCWFSAVFYILAFFANLLQTKNISGWMDRQKKQPLHFWYTNKFNLPRAVTCAVEIYLQFPQSSSYPGGCCWTSSPGK